MEHENNVNAAMTEVLNRCAALMGTAAHRITDEDLDRLMSACSAARRARAQARQESRLTQGLVAALPEERVIDAATL